MDEEEQQPIELDEETRRSIKSLFGKEESGEPISQDIKSWFRELDKRLFLILGMIVGICLLFFFVGMQIGSANTLETCNTFWQDKISNCFCLD